MVTVIHNAGRGRVGKEFMLNKLSMLLLFVSRGCEKLKRGQGYEGISVGSVIGVLINVRN